MPDPHLVSSMNKLWLSGIATLGAAVTAQTGEALEAY